jgi:hypothetical protein
LSLDIAINLSSLKWIPLLGGLLAQLEDRSLLLVLTSIFTCSSLQRLPMLWHFLLMFSEFSEIFLDFFWEHIKIKLNVET